MTSFKQFLQEQEGGAFVSSDMSGTEGNATMAFPGHPLFYPDIDMIIPQVEKTGKITDLILNKNPIYIRLSDGTEAYFTYDEFKRIKGKPALGKTMTIVFYRHPDDRTINYSKISYAFIHEPD